MLGLSKLLSNLRRLISCAPAEAVSVAPEASPAPKPSLPDPKPPASPEPPPNFDWTLPASEAKKLELVGKQDGEIVDDGYMFFDIGEVERLTGEEEIAVISRFFPAGAVINFHDVYLHWTTGPTGKTVSLRLRGRLIFHPALELRGRYCPLYQFGHVDPLFGASKGAINFHSYWNTGKPVHPSPFETAANA